MSMKSKRELLTTISPRYVTATGADKARILDQFVAATGYHRKDAITLLRHPPPPRRRPITRPRTKRYTLPVQRTLVRLWQITGPGLIISHPSGVIYSNLTGGYACDHRELEGVFVPLTDPHVDQSGG